VFDATRAETGNQGRDRKMHEEVLESARYPEIVFTVSGASADLDAAAPVRSRCRARWRSTARSTRAPSPAACAARATA